MSRKQGFWVFLSLAVLVLGIVTIKNFSLRPTKSEEPKAVTSEYIEIEKEKSYTLVLDKLDLEPATHGIGGDTTYFRVEGKLRTASLIVIAFVQKDYLISKWDDIYVIFGNGREQNGGHFLGDDTRYGFNDIRIDLSNARFYPKNNRKDEVQYNFLPLLNSERKLRFDIFISSARPERYIHEATLMYTCDGECEITKE